MRLSSIRLGDAEGLAALAKKKVADPCIRVVIFRFAFCFGRSSSSLPLTVWAAA